MSSPASRACVFGALDLMNGIGVTHACGRNIRGRRNLVRRDARAEFSRGSVFDPRLALDDTGRLAAFNFPLAERHRDWLSHRRAACGRRRNSDVHFLRPGETAFEASGRIRLGRDRRCCRAGGCQQCVGRRNADAAADARPSDVGNGRDDARRFSAVRHQSRPASLRQSFGSRLEPDCEPFHRQLHADRPQSSAGRIVGEAAVHSAALALSRKSFCSRRWEHWAPILRPPNWRSLRFSECSALS